MTFRGNTFNHFMREAKREYGVRRSCMEHNPTRKASPTWAELGDDKRMEWAQYMHDEYFNKPKKELNDMFGKFGGIPYELTWFDEAPECTKAMFDEVLKQRAFGKSIYLQQLGRAVRKEAEPAQVDISENEAVNRRVDALEKDSIQLNEELVRRFEAIERRLDALEYEQEAAPIIDQLAQAKADNESLCDDRKRLNETIAKRTEEINRLRDESLKARVYTAELSTTIEQKNLRIAGLQKELAHTKTTEDTLRKVQEQLSQDLHNERSKAKPYAISREQYEAVTRTYPMQWYTNVKFYKYDFTQMPVVYLTTEQYESVRSLAKFQEL